MKRHHLGFTLIELLIVVILAAAMLGALLHFQYRAARAQQIADTASAISYLVAGAQRTLRPNGSFEGLNRTLLIGLGLIHAPLTTADPAVVRDGAGGEVRFSGNLSGQPPSFIVRLTTDDPEVCAGLATALSAAADEIRVDSDAAQTWGTGVLTGGAQYKTLAGAIDMAALRTGCGASRPLAVGIRFH